LETQPSKALQWVDRLGMVRYTSLLTFLGTTASLLISLTAYSIIGFDPLAEPISIVLPILCPMIIVPTMTVNATRAALKLREQQRHIAEQNRALERILTEKDRIISLVGHDLRGQLNLVMGFAQLISRQADSIPIDRLVDYANEIHHAGSKTNDVLNDLLNWGRARAGHLTHGHEADPFNVILDRVMDALKLEAECKQVTLEAVAPMPENRVDTVIVASALRNVLNNAIKFSHSGGSIDVRADCVGAELRITVTDAGVGINPEQLSRLRSGHLVDSTEGTSREIGSGLGLAICRDVIQAQGGRLEIDSAPNIGTTVTVFIPLN
jgi:two-component system, sensor histidine kinase and response regulator